MSTLFINGKYLAQAITGVQRFASQVLEAVDAQLADGLWQSDHALVLLVPSSRVQPLPRLRRIEIREIPSGNLHAWEQIRLPLAARGFPLLNLAGSAPLLKTGQICTFHDTAVFDFPTAYSPAFRRWYRLLFSVQSRLSRRLLTVSEFSKGRLCRHLGVPPEKVGVVSNAADHMRDQFADESVLGKLGVTSNGYLLAVGSSNPTKNFARLVEAFSGVAGSEVRLVVVGGSNSAVFAENNEAQRSDPRIVRTGRLTDTELKALYTHARAYVFPSVYEGFGLPPLEAMLCGCPVIASTAASIPEVCGPAAAYFDPFSVDAMRDTMTCALRDDAWLDGLRAAGRERAKRYTWHNAADDLLRELALLGVVRPVA